MTQILGGELPPGLIDPATVVSAESPCVLAVGNAAPAKPHWHSFQIPIFSAHETRIDTGEAYQTAFLGSLFTMRPADRPKDAAPSFLPSLYAEHDARSYKAQRERGRFVALTADIDIGDHVRAEIKHAARNFAGDAAWLVYSSSSSRPGHRKWRIIIILVRPLQFPDWHAAQTVFHDELARAGIEPDRSLARAGQPVFAPNVPHLHIAKDGTRTALRDGDGAPLYFERSHSALDAHGFDPSSGWQGMELAALKEQCEADNARRLAAHEEGAKRRLERGNESTPIARFNAANDVIDLLVKYGYEESPASDLDWRSPHQGSGSYATRIMTDGDGHQHWVSLSQSDREARLGRDCDSGCYGDAFDLFVHFEHGGDHKAALAELRMTDTVDDFAGVSSAKAGKTQEATARRFKLDLYFAGAALPPIPPSLLYGVLPRVGVASVIAPSMAGKTTLVLELGRALATGDPFFGVAANERCGTLILAAEGMAGLLSRAYVLSEDGVELSVTIARAPALTGRGDADALAEAIEADVLPLLQDKFGVRLGLVVLDTLSSSGVLVEENTNGEASATISALNRVAERLGCLFLFVHHPAKHGTAARGAYALHANVDAEITIDYDEGKPMRIVRLTKHKEAPAPRVLGCYTLQSVSAGIDSAGDPVTACRIVADEYDAKLSAKAGRAATLTAEQVAACQNAIAGGNFRHASQCGSNWAGHAIGKALGISTRELAERSSVQSILNWLVVEGWLQRVPERDPVRRKTVDCIRVGQVPVEANGGEGEG